MKTISVNVDFYLNVVLKYASVKYRINEDQC